MNFFNRILIILVVFSFYQCKNQDKAKQKSTTFQKQQNKKPIVKKAWDSLNRNNTEAFFNEYSKKNKESIVLIKTEFGNIKLRLFEDVPIHKANFIFLTKIKYFDTTVFYRIAKNFVIQGGNSDEMYTQKQRRKYGNYLLKPEFRVHRTHKYGALAAAREWEENPNKLSSPFEFYIVHSKKGAHHLDNEDTVFGEVISGFDTMDKISKVKVGIDEWPLEDIKMKIEVLE
ncbi:peptidylprolyl isomerase [Polaribacter aestuariivivens]|uniref:Peptidyl-prolyl cis-trans isomerase n=1 Tax=Polaribacter aestuariivivens TaxID=2304626 RepID=A0A5S3N985_9FLAO|nr:peptidylprolyl isomerase [Polaribacter aestuariivivens]TMM31014.1 peptidylprolyl isomerase [Polaribacter aestuariivivens]